MTFHEYIQELTEIIIEDTEKEAANAETYNELWEIVEKMTERANILCEKANEFRTMIVRRNPKDYDRKEYAELQDAWWIAYALFKKAREIYNTHLERINMTDEDFDNYILDSGTIYL